MSNQINWNQLATPNFSASNDLLTDAYKRQQNAVKGLTDMVKGVETDTKNRNYATLMNFVNAAKSTDELQSDVYKQRYQNLYDSFGGVIDAEKAAKLNDERMGILHKFTLAEQQIRGNDQTYQHNAVMNPITEDTAKFTLDRSRTVAQQKDALGTALSYASQGKEAEAKALMGSLGENASTLFNTLNTVDQQNQQQENWKKDYSLREDANNRANNAESREAENHRLGLPAKQLGADVASAQDVDFHVKNPQINNPTYTSDIQKFITPYSMASLKTYQPHLESQSQRTGLPIDLLTGIFGTETAFGLRKDKSSAGAVGAMQIMPATGKNAGYGVSPLKDGSDAESFRFGADYLKAMIGNFNGDVEKGVAAYNAGAGRVQQAINQAKKSGGDWKQYLPAETQTYVSRVGNIQNYFKTGIDGSKLNIDPTINVPTYNAASGTNGYKYSSQEAAYKDSPAGLRNEYITANNGIATKDYGTPQGVGSGKYSDMAKYKEAVGSSNQFNTLEVMMRGKSFKQGFWGGLDKASHTQYEKNRKAISDAFDKLTPAQQVAVAEQTMSDVSRGNIRNSDEWDISSANVLQMQEALAGNINRIRAYGLGRSSLAKAATDKQYLDKAMSKFGLPEDQAREALGMHKTTGNPFNGLEPVAYDKSATSPTESGVKNLMQALTAQPPVTPTTKTAGQLKDSIALLEKEYAAKEQAYWDAKKKSFGKSGYAKEQDAFNKVGMDLVMARRQLQAIE